MPISKRRFAIDAAIAAHLVLLLVVVLGTCTGGCNVHTSREATRLYGGFRSVGDASPACHEARQDRPGRAREAGLEPRVRGGPDPLPGPRVLPRGGDARGGTRVRLFVYQYEVREMNTTTSG